MGGGAIGAVPRKTETPDSKSGCGSGESFYPIKCAAHFHENARNFAQMVEALELIA